MKSDGLPTTNKLLVALNNTPDRLMQLIIILSEAYLRQNQMDRNISGNIIHLHIVFILWHNSHIVFYYNVLLLFTQEKFNHWSLGMYQ